MIPLSPATPIAASALVRVEVKGRAGVLRSGGMGSTDRDPREGPFQLELRGPPSRLQGSPKGLFARNIPSYSYGYQSALSPARRKKI